MCNRLFLIILIILSISGCENPFEKNLYYEKYNLNDFEVVSNSDDLSGVWVGVADHYENGNWWTIVGSKRFIIQISQYEESFYSIDCNGVKSQVQMQGEDTIDILGRRLRLTDKKIMDGRVDFTESNATIENWSWIKISSDQLGYGLMEVSISNDEPAETLFNIEAYCEYSLLYDDEDGDKKLKEGFGVAWADTEDQGGYLQYWDNIYETQDHDTFESGRSYYQELFVPNLDIDVTSKKDSMESSFEGSIMEGYKVSFKGDEINTNVGLYSFEIKLDLNSWGVGE